jgi:hypothetical protein
VQGDLLHRLHAVVLSESAKLTDGLIYWLHPDMLQERNDVLEKAFEEAHVQAAQHREQMSEMQESLKKATKVLQVSWCLSRSWGHQGTGQWHSPCTARPARLVT